MRTTRAASRREKDADVYVAKLMAASTLDYSCAPGRSGWQQLIKGELTVNGKQLHPGDGAAVTGEERLSMTAGQDSLFLLFDLN